MIKTLVLYKSKYGSTKQYAGWIAAELSADLFEASEFKTGSWEEYSTIVYCGGLYASSISGVRIIVKNQEKLGDKKIVVVACGLSHPNDEKAVERVENGLFRKLSQTIQKDVKLFFLRGGITYSKLRFFDNTVLWVMEKTLRKRKPEALGPEDRQMLDVLGDDFSFVDHGSIRPIIEYCKEQ